LHTLPKNFKDLLNKNPKAKATWDDITPLARNEWICWTTSAKQKETNERRLKIALENLSTGKRRPCCWAGCMHR
jgi:uncharacterized protein YdeI (YjbR/CyaY-like superfamily)